MQSWASKAALRGSGDHLAKVFRIHYQVCREATVPSVGDAACPALTEKDGKLQTNTQTNEKNPPC